MDVLTLGPSMGQHYQFQYIVVLCWDFKTVLCYKFPIHSEPIRLEILCMVLIKHSLKLKHDCRLKYNLDYLVKFS